MAKKEGGIMQMGNKLGAWAFLIGIAIAIILGFMGNVSDWLLVLVIIGIIVGLFNVADEETMPFLLSGAVLVIVTSQGQQLFSSVEWLANIFNAMLALFTPATIVVAIKNVFSLAKN